MGRGCLLQMVEVQQNKHPPQGGDVRCNVSDLTASQTFRQLPYLLFSIFYTYESFGALRAPWTRSIRIRIRLDLVLLAF